MKAIAGLFVFGSVLVLGGAAMAQCEASAPNTCDSAVSPVTLNPTPATPSVAPAAPRVQARQQLPVTGSDAGLLALAGTILVGGGAALVWRTKGNPAA